jgi:hypothetical protein
MKEGYKIFLKEGALVDNQKGRMGRRMLGILSLELPTK